MGYTSKTLDNHIQAADLSSDLALRAQSGENWLVTYNVTRNKLVTF